MLAIALVVVAFTGIRNDLAVVSPEAPTEVARIILIPVKLELRHWVSPPLCNLACPRIRPNGDELPMIY